MAPEIYYSDLYFEEKKAHKVKEGEMLVVDNKEVPISMTKGFTTKSDVYAFAIVLWVLFNLKLMNRKCV
jgi:hypothetical protein